MKRLLSNFSELTEIVVRKIDNKIIGWYKNTMSGVDDWHEHCTAEIYNRLNQFQRFILLIETLRARNRPRWPWGIWIIIKVWPIKCWEYGIDMSQEFEHISLGPIEIRIRC